MTYQVGTSKSVLSPNTILAQVVMKMYLHQFIVFIFLKATNSSVSFWTHWTHFFVVFDFFFSGVIEENFPYIDLVLTKDLGTLQLLHVPWICLYMSYTCLTCKHWQILVLQCENRKYPVAFWRSWKLFFSFRTFVIMTDQKIEVALDKTLPSLVRKIFLSLNHNNIAKVSSL